MGTTLTDLRVGGGGHANLGEVLLCGSKGVTYFWIRDVGGDPPYGEVPGGSPPPGAAMYHG